jgi:uncharacterized tellurite resistance protein B-like protein
MAFDGERLREQHGNTELLETFSDDEALALVDLAFLVVMIDGEVTDRELEEISHHLLGVVFDREAEAKEMLESHGALETRERLHEYLASDEDLAPFVEARTDRIDDSAHRKAALEVLGTLSYADGLDSTEEGICHEIGRAFGFDEETIEACLVDGAVDVWELGDERID